MTLPARRWASRRRHCRLGLIGLVQFAPLFILTLVTGWTADRVDRRWIARAAIALELACALALAWFAWRGTTTLPLLYTVAALLGVARAFAGPALGSARAQSRSAQDPAERHRSVVDRLAKRRHRRPCARRLSLRLGAGRALRRQRAAVWRRAHRAVGHRPGPASRNHGDPQSLGADGRRPALRAPQPPRARAPSASTCSPCCWAARPRCCRCSRATCCTPGRRVSGICAPRRRSGRR